MIIVDDDCYEVVESNSYDDEQNDNSDDYYDMFCCEICHKMFPFQICLLTHMADEHNEDAPRKTSKKWILYIMKNGFYELVNWKIWKYIL